MDSNPEINPFRVFHILNGHGVQYLVVGGTAVIYYGDFRKSQRASGEEVDKPDLDLWYNPTYANYFKLLDAIEELGKDVAEYRADPQPEPKKSVFRLTFEDYTLDLLTSIKASIKFADAFARRKVTILGSAEVGIISLPLTISG